VGTMGRPCLMLEVVFLALAISSLVASPFFCCPALRGKRMRRARYSLRRATLAERDSVERFWRRGSTEIPIVGASLRGIPASCALSEPMDMWPPSQKLRTFNSVKVKPRPALTRRLYLIVGHRTTGLSLSTGRGATAAAFERRALRRLSFRPG
jgi:hypothetical protein